MSLKIDPEYVHLPDVIGKGTPSFGTSKDVTE